MINQQTTENLMNHGCFCPFSGQGNKGHIHAFYEQLHDTIYDEEFLQQLGKKTRETLQKKKGKRNRPGTDKEHQLISNIPAEESKASSSLQNLQAITSHFAAKDKVNMTFGEDREPQSK